MLDSSHAARIVSAVRTLLAGRKRLSTDQKRRLLRQIVQRVDVTVVPTGEHQPRAATGGFTGAGGPQWAVERIELRLALPAGANATDANVGDDAQEPTHCAPSSRSRLLDTTSSGCGQVPAAGDAVADLPDGVLVNMSMEPVQVAVAVGR